MSNEIKQVLADIGFEFKCEYVPYSIAKEVDPFASDRPCKYWAVEVVLKGRKLKGRHYFKQGVAVERLAWRYGQMLESLEKGLEIKYPGKYDLRNLFGKAFEAPDAVDLAYSIVLDCLHSLQYDSFEDWATTYGYDEDSRKAEKIYKHLRDYGVMFNNRLTAEEKADLFNAYEEY